MRKSDLVEADKRCTTLPFTGVNSNLSAGTEFTGVQIPGFVEVPDSSGFHSTLSELWFQLGLALRLADQGQADLGKNQWLENFGNKPLSALAVPCPKPPPSTGFREGTA